MIDIPLFSGGGKGIGTRKKGICHGSAKTRSVNQEKYNK